MAAVTRCIKDARRSISKTGRKRLSSEKIAARRIFRSRLKASDRNNAFEVDVIRPCFTAYDIT